VESSKSNEGSVVIPPNKKRRSIKIKKEIIWLRLQECKELINQPKKLNEKISLIIQRQLLEKGRKILKKRKENQSIG